MKIKIKWIAGIFICLSLIFLLKIISPFGSEAYNLIIFTLDTTRADYIDVGFGAKAKTPNILQIAKKSTVCTNAYTVAPITMPAHTSLFTGKYPYKNEVFNNGDQYDNRYPTLAEILKKKGYTTGAVISLGVLNQRFGLAGGYDIYQDQPYQPIGYKTTGFEYGDLITRSGLKILEGFKKEKFVLWLHYSDPHAPYAPPNLQYSVSVHINNQLVTDFNLYSKIHFSIPVKLRPGANEVKFDYKELPGIFNKTYPIFIKDFTVNNHNNMVSNVNFQNVINIPQKPLLIAVNNKSKIIIKSPRDIAAKLEFFSIARYSESAETKRLFYKKEVEYMDNEIGKIIEFLKDNNLLQKTVLGFIGDHGEGLGEYKKDFGHIHYLRPQYIKIPFILYFPSEKARIIEEPISIIDFMPTLSEYFKINSKKLQLDGRSIFAKQKYRQILSSTYKPQSRFNAASLVSANKQFILYGGENGFEEFLDLGIVDGYDDDDILKSTHSSDVVQKMRGLTQKILRKIKRKKGKQKMSEKTKKTLKTLGYL